MRRFRGILKYVATAVLLLCGVPILLARVYSAAGWDRGPGKPTVGKETTYLTEPVDEEGFVDYAAALNAELGAGVKVEDNAAVDVLRAVGPSGVPAEIRDEYFEELGIELLPDEGDYFVDFAEFSGEEDAEAIDALREQHEIARRRPWSREEFPEIARWLAANERPLELALAASRKPRFYSPLLTTIVDPLQTAPLPATEAARHLSRALLTRALLRIKEGSFSAARDDLFAVRRIALLVDQESQFISALVAIALESSVVQAEFLLAADSRFDDQEFGEFRKAVMARPALRSMQSRLDRSERLALLDAVAHIARFGPKAAETAESDDWRPEAIDWDIVGRALNDWCDRVAQVAGDSDPQRRLAQLKALDDEASSRGHAIKSPWNLVALLPFARSLRSKLMADVFLATLVPPTSAAAAAELRGLTNRSLTDVAFALAAAHRADGKFPRQLADLVPTHLPRLPQDGFGQSLVYAPSENGFRLYSLGQNGIDETAATVLGDKTGDDLGLGYPLE
ncbi:MAG: hypothetical protein U0836_26885 [Pirellulales bacterium]